MGYVWKIMCAEQKMCATGYRARGKTKTHAQKCKPEKKKAQCRMILKSFGGF